MRRHCSMEDWERVGVVKMMHDHVSEPCGRVYEDVTHSTICPHNYLGPGGAVIYNAENNWGNP